MSKKPRNRSALTATPVLKANTASCALPGEFAVVVVVSQHDLVGLLQLILWGDGVREGSQAFARLKRGSVQIEIPLLRGQQAFGFRQQIGLGLPMGLLAGLP